MSSFIKLVADIADSVSVIDNLISYAGAWNVNTDYSKNQVVTYNGSAYVAKIDNVGKQPDTNTNEWNLFIEKGNRGLQGFQGPPGSNGTNGTNGIDGVLSVAYAFLPFLEMTSTNPYDNIAFDLSNSNNGIPDYVISGKQLVFKGQYNSSTAYVPYDLVTDSGTTYMCIKNTTGNSVSNTTYWSYWSYGISNFTQDPGITSDFKINFGNDQNAQFNTVISEPGNIVFNTSGVYNISLNLKATDENGNPYSGAIIINYGQKHVNVTSSGLIYSCNFIASFSELSELHISRDAQRDPFKIVNDGTYVSALTITKIDNYAPLILN